MRDYWQMVREWNAILIQPLSDDAKQKRCLAVLSTYIGRMAIARLGQPHPALRFYADMIVLEREICPNFGNDALVTLALVPGYRLVRDWVRRNTEPRAHA